MGTCSRATDPTAVQVSHALDILVRDRVPEWLESKGNITECRILNDTEFERALRDSVNRYARRFAETGDLELLCDLVEAVDTWLALRGVSSEALAHAREERRKRCGGFDKRLFLQSITPGDGALRLRGRTC
ncbi:MAG: nucleoside triphosphate pyrophosphohydrolase [Thermoflavifilum sp.]|nr:nucleoside triphosphate pyrophosphohydrolase [Thermoflavifilum sp.]MCL6514624.1 nucleoside triphosphate pyrophosphohydrolase [Alicyclobacillus sp.]